ncbi:MAG: aspartate--ammonia ligase [Hyphomicrobiales bacterium]
MGADSNLIIPKDYYPKLSLIETEKAIKFIKDNFQKFLSNELNLTRVSAPLFVIPETGLNDNLNGIEKPVDFTVKCMDKRAEVVQSLAKWKRLALKRYKFAENTGLYTDMNAIRPDEDLDNLHSLYVDQWDWEKVIDRSDRNVHTLKDTVKSIFNAFKQLDNELTNRYPMLSSWLPETIHFVTAQELEDRYPEDTPKERENKIVRELKAVFIMGIGGDLNSGKRHDGRAADYDDWNLNGDIIFYHQVLDCAIELSSMGIRVDKESLYNQIKISGNKHLLDMPFQDMIMKRQLPYTIGGGIGQSRICMFFLQKVHVGEVQASIWPENMIELCERNNIHLF